MRPSEERAILARSVRTTRRIALAALVIGLVAFGITAWRFLTPADAGCQTAAWDATPAAGQLPLGWTISASQYDVGRKSMTLLGPAPADTTTSRAVLYATITCYPQGAADSVNRSANAATAAGQTVTPRTDLGDQGFVSADASGATFLQFRRGSVVVYIAASGDATADEVNTVASAFDLGMGGTGGNAPVGSPITPVGSPITGVTSPSIAPGSDVPGSSPSDSPAASAAAAPALEALLPTTVGTIQLTVDSALGTSILGTDQGSRAILAALRADGKTADDLSVAQAYDPTGAADLSLLAVSVKGMSLASMKALVLSTWLAASGAGVTTTTVTLSGHEFTKIDYGDQGSVDYLLAEGDHVILIETGSADIATQAAAALP
jgi:hypothetical protein